jgi:hypothetical protein
MGTPIRFLGWVPYQGFGIPSFGPLSMRATVINHGRGRDWRASTAATGRRIVPSFPESLWGRAWGCFGGPVGVRNGTPNAVVSSMPGLDGKPRGLEFRLDGEISLSSRMWDRIS